MTDDLSIRLTREADMQAHCDIVNRYIEGTTINFRMEPQTPQEWCEDWKKLSDTHPWLVAEDADGLVLGLAYASPWKPRPAYGWSVETTVYVRDGQHRRGVGRRLYARLLQILDAQGYQSQIGVIALPNESSVALHEAMGFEHIGTLRNVGFKHEGWRSTGLWQRSLNQDGAAPPRLLPVSLAYGGDGGGA
ncbi:MAG TPA: GNAT family N-acetyltransferase [Actinocrinis sp.]|nr:GNAT family N-acetyltransferase [Actinocrinis sp.]